LPVFLPQRLGSLDVALLALFRPAGQQDDFRRTIDVSPSRPR
jgi:hypothetical protein